MTSQDLSSLQKRLSYFFREPKRLRQALTHKSYLNESRDKTSEDNERYEFMGDAVLDLIVSEALMERFPGAPEGDLSKMKAKVVSEGTLARTAREIGLGRFLLLGRGEEMTLGREKSSLLADAMEAVIAAVYLDGGFPAAREVVLREFASPLQELTRADLSIDYKTELQELCQKKFETLPAYSLIRESGPDHQKIFEVEIQIRGIAYGTGAGKSKKEAEQKAARTALERLREEEKLMNGRNDDSSGRL
ncbi:MAG TPA: ribonuclease III [Candidatus Manganitrophaceae bacterium]|nr:ribonuclease III [Candidatus Manganitrophaceae bacterium]